MQEKTESLFRKAKRTFNLPNFLDYVPWYSTRPVGQYSKGGVPNITGEIAIGYGINGTQIFSGQAFSVGTNNINLQSAASGVAKSTVFDASRSSNVYTNYERVVPANATCLFYIKY